jgi:hypothetical protein
MPRRPDWTDIKEGDDVYALLKGVYEHGRALPRGGNPHDYRAPDQKPQRRARMLGHEPASYDPANDTKVSKPLDESGPQFRDEKTCHHNDTQRNWTIGYGDAPHFDGNRLSGAKGNRHE